MSGVAGTLKELLRTNWVSTTNVLEFARALGRVGQCRVGRLPGSIAMKIVAVSSLNLGLRLAARSFSGAGDELVSAGALRADGFRHL